MKQEIKALVYRASDGDAKYWAEVPSCPGCFTQGDTMEEVRDNLAESLDGWLESMGDGYPSIDDVDITVDVRDEPKLSSEDGEFVDLAVAWGKELSESERERSASSASNGLPSGKMAVDSPL